MLLSQHQMRMKIGIQESFPPLAKEVRKIWIFSAPSLRGAQRRGNLIEPFFYSEEGDVFYRTL